MRKALVLSSVTVHNNFDEITRLLEHEHRDAILDGIRRQIHGDLPAELGLKIYDIEVDLPRTTPLNEATLSVVKQPNGQLVPLNHLFPSNDWLDAFVARKWRGHVFCRGSDAIQRAVGEAARRILQAEPFNLEIDDLAIDLALGASPV